MVLKEKKKTVDGKQTPAVKYNMCPLLMRCNSRIKDE